MSGKIMGLATRSLATALCLCAGLCPVCGINRNRETCTCQSEWVDPRMEPLKRLKQHDRKD